MPAGKVQLQLAPKDAWKMHIATMLAASIILGPLSGDTRERLEGDRAWLMSMECSIPKLSPAADAAARAARKEMCTLEAHMKDALRDGPIVLKQED